MATYDDLMAATVVLGRPGLAGTGITAAEKTAIDTRLEALAEPQPLGEHSDFDDSGAAAGLAILRNATNDGYVLGSAAGSLAAVSQDGTVVDSDVTDLNFTGGLTVVPGAPGGGVNVTPTFAGTGTAPSMARSDHFHTIDSVSRVSYGQSGYLSSGSRSLASVNVTLAAGILYLVEAEVIGQWRGADAGAAYFRISLTIDGNTRTSPAGSAGKWCVQGVPGEKVWKHERTVAGTGTQITVSATTTYGSGAGFNVDAGEVAVRLRPIR